jgi:hypothetical protein
MIEILTNEEIAKEFAQIEVLRFLVKVIEINMFKISIKFS